MQEENFEKFGVPEACLGPCSLSMINFFAKMVKGFWVYTISELIQFFYFALNIDHDMSVSYGI